MKPLLFLSQRIPFPPNKGDKLRSFSVLRHLAKSWKIHLGCFVDDPADWRYLDDLRPYCADLCCVGLDKRWAKLKSLRGLVSGTSLSVPYFHSRRLSQWVGTVLRDVQPQAAFLFSSVMGQYIPDNDRLRPRRVVMDFVDVDSDKWRQYAQMHSLPMSWVYGRESRRLLAFDRGVAGGADASIFVSAPEAALFRQLAPEVAAKTHAISNGIDFSYFSADTSQPSPFPAGSRGVVFTGAMDYWPNVDAAIWFAEEMFPAIRARVPEAVLFIVGGNPAPKVVKLGELPGVTVTGRVPDVRPYLTYASASVAPLRVARGIQNKVLEGMAMGKVVITTDQGLEGIEALPGRELLVANDVASFISATVRALTDASLAPMGAAARRRIVDSYSWDDKLAEFERLLDRA
ncbi:TIGR03087 family PEP-CTERM/XrtA system glycosyltransferase [Telmatospirillum sp.]|uniref:TIGR03087 family PEP-CTERM/XrtA system glycosyltransferase n=1 Tax=Telmatospirillum sp. TaxID=2079197 RepID=UPI00283FA217|nr:TIGR03087 family PEP-CTERM/XrtA system glycosyltransferase [Telmatospirillum sp.]MDR3439926.1 TIGR03087 family PEP-CTERM/XrtA system glycosyltransferase [Telmatospirillum sp.]